MKLVKLGQIILNFDLATYIRDPGGAGSSAPLMVEFGPGQCLEVVAGADVLRAWLAANLTDITPAPASTLA
ncbi:MAG: hypothetical protein JWN86_2032 [Planctomycetota bacterium]|nr:hypothetical protein [Planctomycetota bacterium]